MLTRACAHMRYLLIELPYHFFHMCRSCLHTHSISTVTLTFPAAAFAVTLRVGCGVLEAALSTQRRRSHRTHALTYIRTYTNTCQKSTYVRTRNNTHAYIQDRYARMYKCTYVRPYKDTVCSMQEQQQTYSLVQYVCMCIYTKVRTHVYVSIHTQVQTYVHTYVLVQWFGTREMLSLSTVVRLY